MKPATKPIETRLYRVGFYYDTPQRRKYFSTIIRAASGEAAEKILADQHAKEAMPNTTIIGSEPL